MALNALHSQHVQADLPKARHSIPPPFQLKKKKHTLPLQVFCVLHHFLFPFSLPSSDMQSPFYLFFF